MCRVVGDEGLVDHHLKLKVKAEAPPGDSGRWQHHFR